MRMSVRIGRIYDPVERGNGARVLVDRVWPRGLRKADESLTAWFKDIAPSTELRKWFSHRPERWDEFRRRYQEELSKNPEAVGQLCKLMEKGPVVLLYGARDREHNNAVALKEYLDRHHAK